MRTIVDLTGQHFGMLTVKAFAYGEASKPKHWLCQCDCGQEKVVAGANLRSGRSKSCGCISRSKWAAARLRNPPPSAPMGRPDITGKRYGLVTVLGLEVSQSGNRLWKCQCDCGNGCVLSYAELARRGKPSCGCHKGRGPRAASVAMSPEAKVVHGTWVRMKRRCLYESGADYPRYGGRGISVCERWMNFENFLADMGLRPSSDHSIDRIDVNGNYEPDNCRWATFQEQANNRRDTIMVEVAGEQLPLAVACRTRGVPIRTVRRRLAKGMNIEQALTQERYSRYR